MNIKNILLIALTSTLLIACKAEVVELDIKTKDVFAAVDGEAGLIDFEAKFSNFGELDEEGSVKFISQDNFLPNTVLNQNPKEGTKVSQNSSINLIISK